MPEAWREINLDAIPWPVSVLVCNRHIEAMAPGDRLRVTLCDSALKDNLQLLFNSHHGLTVRLARQGRRYQFDITCKKGSAETERQAPGGGTPA